MCGVVTDTARLRAWAADRQLTVLDPHSDFASELARSPFEHLFAITHLERVAEPILQLPTRSAINFHDGPLPESCGLHTPAWAIVHGERQHGVTWHVMTPELDGGPILQQRRFEIAAGETSFSLNVRCFEAAIESFTGLVAELADGQPRLSPQDLRRRRVFGKHDRPRAACTIDWSRSASEIDALVRALDFGRHPNPLGVAKIRHARRGVLVTSASVTEVGASPNPDGPTNGSASPADATPGTVLACGDGELLVATADGTLALRGFADPSGRTLDPVQVAERLGLAPGIVLDALEPEQAERWTALDRRMSRSEPFWVQRLTEFEPITLPLPAPIRGADSTDGARPTAIAIDVPPELLRRFPEHPPSLLLLAACCAQLARSSRRTTFDIGVGDAALRRETAAGPWLAAWSPLRVDVDLDQPLATLLERLADGMAELRGHAPRLHDLLARFPELDALRRRTDGLLPVTVDRCDACGAPELIDGAQWTLEVGDTTPTACRIVYDGATVAAAHADSLAQGFAALLAGLAANPDLPLAAHAMVSPEELLRQRVDWNQTALPYDRDACVHELVGAQVARTPQAVALVSGDECLTYAELDERAERLAAELARRGVRPGQLVGIFLERSVDLVVAVLGTLKAGAAYVPLDPAHPSERLALLLEDAEVAVVVTTAALQPSLPASAAQTLLLDGDLPHGSASARAARPSDLAYVIYTSGSTGRPKGVLVEHRNVTAFFAAMDQRIPHATPGVWLALTSLSFDISVLELLWPLCHGFEVVVHAGDEHVRTRPSSPERPIDFSLFFFSSDEAERNEGYRLLLEGARFADAHGFRAVWTPERHFHAFGGLYPNPAVTGAALAAITQHVQIRAGSVVLPLHHPIRVAEDWALVDNLSAGRVAISFASGWHPDDFVLAPHNHATAKEILWRDIEVVRRLWRGETLAFPGPDGNPVDVRTLPRPVQSELPVWVTAAGNPETYVGAGRIGANVLTHLLGQSPAELAPKIRAYREARAQAGFDPATGVVSLMLHTFVGEDEERVREQVGPPLERYLGSSLSLLKHYAWNFPAFRRPGGASEHGEADLAELHPEEQAALLRNARDRYYETSGLFGTPERCLEQIARLRAVGVDEIACLIDFGLPVDEVLASLPLLDLVRSRAQALGSQEGPRAGASIPAEIRERRVTHLQCTPSLARIMCSDPEVRSALGDVQHVFVGGEALPAELAAELASAVGGSLTNMYGPTETTIWSATHAVGSAAGVVPIGRGIANTRLHVLDERLHPLPIGVPGELCIAGDGVARGYLRRADLEAACFVPEAGAPDAGARMYRTGDLVRYRADGVLEFLGRVDHQIKIRGHRVEPGEIEAQLMSPSVSDDSLSEVVVVAREDSPGDQRLIAFLVPRSTAPDAELLRERLQARLPAHMVPGQFVFLERLPRNSNGKIDRSALPQPEPREPARQVLPAGALETRLAQLWSEVLALPQVGVEDNFFDLGGHSLLIVRLHRRMHEVVAEPVALTDLFRFPTIRSLARQLTTEATPRTMDEAHTRGRIRRRATPQRRQRALEG
ncbi:MAG TPA: MupA/Atu3671 family FMN-dependent luciferase-like monooxygenase [Planctomycetota bacterium]|nr:MupA/Atu3671 family FMN-dependent luciferase-like monooxygenase [Planctomycetota bacterium]